MRHLAIVNILIILIVWVVSVVRPTLLYISSEAVIPAKAGIQPGNTGFPRIKYGAGLVKPGMTIKVKGLLTQYISKLEIQIAEV